MSSKRNKKRKECIGKVKHEKEGHAIGAKKLLKEKLFIQNISHYKCKFCGFFHIGRVKAGERKGKQVKSVWRRLN